MQQKSSASFVSLSAFIHAAAFLGLALLPAFKDSLNKIQPIEMTTINSGDLGEAKSAPVAAAPVAPVEQPAEVTPKPLPAKVTPVAKTEKVKKAAVEQMIPLPKKKIIEIKPEEDSTDTQALLAAQEAQEVADRFVEEEARLTPVIDQPIQSTPLSAEDQVVQSTASEAAEQAVAKQMEDELPAPETNNVVERLGDMPAESTSQAPVEQSVGNGNGDIDMGAVAGPTSDDLRSYLELKQAPGNRPPQYPESSRRKGEQGQVILNYYVTAQGSVREVRIVSSSGFSALDKAATRSASQLKFVPGQEGWAAHTMVFSLQGDSAPSPSRLRAAGNSRAESNNN